jgi:hypothetical protein
VTGGYTGGPYGWGGYSMGYKFTPTQPGAVTQLGRFRGAYNDGSTIKLWDAANGNLLATANVTGTNWSYADITPVALTVGHEYWVTTYGGANVYYYIMPYEPYAVDGVKIIGGSYYWGDGMPTDYGYGVAYGMPDIHFERPSNVYLVQGNDGGFFRYDVTLNQWASLGKAPPQGGKWKSGSFLTSDGDHTIYAHRAECSPCELWAYDVTSGSWSQLSGMPGAKSQAGGCGDWYDGGIYAMKGANTNEFWRWDASAQWNALDPIPGVGVGMGADIVSHGRGAFFALKGGNTRELWVYVYVPEQLEGVQSSVTGRVEDAGMSLTLTPSPLVGNVLRIGYSLNQAGPASVTLFDVSGRAVAKRGFVAVRAGQLPLDLRRLSAGVYLVRLDDGHQSVVQKLVVQR